MRKVYDDKELVAIGANQVFARGETELGWITFWSYGKQSAGLPEIHKSSTGTEYQKVLQVEPYQSNAVVMLAALGTDDNGNYQFAKTMNDKNPPKEVYVRERITGLNAFNIALTDKDEIVMFLTEQPEKKKVSGFDSL